MAHPFHSIGHGRRSLAEFVELLQSVEVTCLVDVRTVPRSRANPQYNRDTLPQQLAPLGIGYEHIAALGGLRGRVREVAHDVNAFWDNESFHNYADYAMSEGFRDGLCHLRELGRERRCAIMCAETVWWRCHRRIITDYLLAAGERVVHILDASHIEEATLTPSAAVRGDGTVVYPGEEPSSG
jgi:uncharacterized protein (DUF488 family)